MSNRSLFCFCKNSKTWNARLQPPLPWFHPRSLPFTHTTVQLNKQLPAQITIHNPSGSRIAFKVRFAEERHAGRSALPVARRFASSPACRQAQLSPLPPTNDTNQQVKTTTPKKYVVRPSSGAVDPGMTASVQVIMQAQKEFPADMGACRDKFLVQALALAPGEDLGPETFRAGAPTKDTKIRVALEGPPAPPSPVPEVNETEEDASLLAAGAAGAGAGALAGGARALGGGASDGVAAVGAGGLSQENRVLRAQVERLVAERDQMRRQLDAAARGGGGKAGAAAAAGRSGGAASAGALSPAVLLVAALLAMLAFLFGHYAHELVPGGLPLPPLNLNR